MAKFKVSEILWHKGLKKKGKVIATSANGEYKVEVITAFDKETATRTTTLTTWNEKDLDVYRKPVKRKADLRNYKVDNVRKFHKAFNHPVAYKPTVMDAERALNRTVWTGEELVEFLQASSHNKEQFDEMYARFLEGLDGAYTKSVNAGFPQNDEERLVAQSDALTDVEYFVDGSFVELGVNPLPLFDIVQRANMGKLHDGKPKYREDGKILKPENWERDFAPEQRLSEEIKRQIKG